MLVDAYSKFIDIKLLQATTAQNLTNTLEDIFVIFGLATEIVCDNGPQLNSIKFS